MADDGGISELIKAMRAIPAQIQADIQPALEQGADEMVARMKYLAPYDDGDLQQSIRKEAGDRPLSVRVTAGGELTTKPVRKSEKGTTPEYDYALGQ